MSNYTDNFKGTNMDPRPEEDFPAEVRAIENARMLYREIIEAAVLLCKRRGFVRYPRIPTHGAPAVERLSFLDVAGFIESHVSEEMRRLSDSGYDYMIEGDDHQEFFDRMHALLTDAPTPLPMTEGELTALTDAVSHRDSIQGATVLKPVPNQAMKDFSVAREIRKDLP